MSDKKYLNLFFAEHPDFVSGDSLSEDVRKKVLWALEKEYIRIIHLPLHKWAVSVFNVNVAKMWWEKEGKEDD